ncbi:RNA-binding cell elongation regulator Jag/EloR [Streptococcus sp. NLN76]|uniref:RNA-binding cell elongation regulator Jag/EloR n=1 Tax=Streptococcus sp. NLN76 TaxID=2822800 RepID=UPI0018A94EC0|nr:RNA-binding cell elongation regulator Jag/EloR [Streptococcus sp. NLN76]MBF8971056.1 protein jag [Streptococcus sp. NLN76]
MARYTGATVEEAIQQGLDDLGLPRMKVRIKVLAREKSGFLGIGKKPAQVEMEALDFKEDYDFEDTTPLPSSLLAEAEEIEEEVSPEANLQSSEDMAEAISKLEETGKLSILFPRDLPNETLGEEEEAAVDDQLESQATEISEPLIQVESIEVASEPAEVVDTEPELEAEPEIEEQPETIEESLAEEEVGEVTFVTVDPEPEPEPVTFVRRERDSLEEEQMDQAQTYLESVLREMDVEATVSASISRRTIYFQIDTNEPGRVIGYHGKVLKSLQLLAQNYLYNLYGRTLFISINVNDYVEHRAEVLQSYAQKLALRVLEEGRAMETDPMSNSERKIIHRIISKIDGVTSYSEGDEPNRYVVVDIEEDEAELI